MVIIMARLWEDGLLRGLKFTPHWQKPVKWFRGENEPSSRELEVVIFDKWHSWMSIKQTKTLLSSPQLPE